MLVSSSLILHIRIEGSGKNCRAIVRTGEFAPYANIILRLSDGVLNFEYAERIK